MCLACIDQPKSDAFAERLVGLFTGGALSLMISIGYRTRLFDTMAEMDSASSREIADRAGLNERYVREWLGAMVTGGIVEIDAETNTYTLPAEHAASLIRGAAPDNMSVTAQFIPLLGSVEDDIVDCFTRGGGVPYTRFHRFHEVMADESNQTVVAGLEAHILPLVSGLQDRLRKGIKVLDVGCGSGRALIHLAQLFPASTFVGYDFSEEAVERARSEAERLRVGNATYRIRDAAQIGEVAEYDFITAFDAIHDQARPAAVLDGIRRALKPDGVFLMQDIRASTPHADNVDNPLAPLLYTISCMHCMTVSLANGGAGLGAMWGRQLAERMLREAGFAHTDVHELAHDPMNYWYVSR